MQARIRHYSLAHYLAAVGIIGLYDVSSRWDGVSCWLDADASELAGALEQTRRRRGVAGLLPLIETAHPLWCNRGRRSLLRGVTKAREWLDIGDAESQHGKQRTAELLHLLTGEEQAQRFGEPKDPQTNPNWNLGSLCPGVLEHNGGGARVSAWLAVLAWEAQRLIETRASAEKGDISVMPAGDYYSWIAHEWSETLSAAEVFLLLSGGWRRWTSYSGRAMRMIRQPYILRDTSSSGKTAEFCRDEHARREATADDL